MRLFLISFVIAFLSNWHGQLLISVEKNKEVEIRKAAYAALDKWVRCGYEPPDSIKIIFENENPEGIDPDKDAICGMGEFNGHVIWIDTHSSLFGEFGRCSTYEDVIGHEIEHLMGYDHQGEADEYAFKWRLKQCGFYKNEL